jgi:hypothetical protein
MIEDQKRLQLRSLPVSASGSIRETALQGAGIHDFVFVSASSWRHSPDSKERSTMMWWECSECGGHVERSRAPVQCCDCGTAGVIFVPVDDATASDPEAESLRAIWLRAGLERARNGLAA